MVTNYKQLDLEHIFYLNANFISSVDANCI